jgi:hypothetical protein
MVQYDAFPVTERMSFESATTFKEKINEVGVVTVSSISALLLPRFNYFFTLRAYKSATSTQIEANSWCKVMQCIDDKDYTAAIKIGIEIIFRPGVSRYNCGIAHLGKLIHPFQ